MKRKQKGSTGPQPGFSPKPKSRKPVFVAEDNPTPTPEPITPDLSRKLPRKSRKPKSKRRKS